MILTRDGIDSERIGIRRGGNGILRLEGLLEKLVEIYKIEYAWMYQMESMIQKWVSQTLLNRV